MVLLVIIVMELCGLVSIECLINDTLTISQADDDVLLSFFFF